MEKNTAADAVILCETIEFNEKQAIKVAHPHKEISVVIIQKDQRYYAYENVCPHFSVQLDYKEGQFSLYQNQVIMCAHHSALFDIETGVCIDGPCKGKQLQVIEIEHKNAKIFLASTP
ncbi:Rieske 2Fe-2S domain-containing protein [Vitreoscilla massiliensis]|uniref:Rieske 2Fe-2S domain-containing protein n=1 Tax=Vitreoscilla massiliensis TaxID=1689272 RepID=A0ABY4E1S4_9NEIS|nr:Rieske 2Fe-2S domain-containing protein [Vitreoscilla massiliensis]UOO89263.1 Rieske 2Fe-2S domain-containing protein [Vitreoscilla massiliensis]